MPYHCTTRPRLIKHGARHGLSQSPEYGIWQRILNRCYRAKDKNYHNYGGRGIVVAPCWWTFPPFYRDMGSRPSPDYSIERINNNGNYEPDNCKWATDDEQRNNTQRSRRLTHNGKTQTLKQWTQELGYSGYGKTFLQDRLASGWSVADALTRPLKTRP